MAALAPTSTAVTTFVTPPFLSKDIKLENFATEDFEIQYKVLNKTKVQEFLANNPLMTFLTDTLEKQGARLIIRYDESNAILGIKRVYKNEVQKNNSTSDLVASIAKFILPQTLYTFNDFADLKGWACRHSRADTVDHVITVFNERAKPFVINASYAEWLEKNDEDFKILENFRNIDELILTPHLGYVRNLSAIIKEYLVVPAFIPAVTSSPDTNN